ncbi:MAG TPA: prepilin-type N-terminal cleavage/methylation domain-containing protein, partial [Candidatus Saccharibacteria bacterium]|nr:prepilin-type N-terminal cleavage/methylation domain-containing protein [Candidatus Saccharibacteria bacterium]
MLKRISPAFTIVELLIVIVVIGILVTIMAVAFNGITRDAAVAALQSDIKHASTTLELHKIDNSTYPTTEEAA